MRTSLKIFPRNASCPPRGRGNERFLLSFIGCARSTPAPGTVRSRPARVRFFVFSLYNHRAPRLRKLPFPPRGRGNERFLLSFIGCARSAPAPGTVRSRPARAETCNIRQYNPRALLEIKNNRFPLHKHSVSTYPLSLLSAFPQNLTVPRGERTLPPRPSPQSGRAGGVFP